MSCSDHRLVQHPQTLGGPRELKFAARCSFDNAMSFGFDCFPRTRYQGSKWRLANWIVSQLTELDFDTVLDALGGTGSIAYALKCVGKKVTYNDLLAFNHQIGLALIENTHVRLDDSEVRALSTPDSRRTYPNFIQRTFQDIYFTDEENAWLDRVLVHIGDLRCRFKRALAYFGVFQAAIAKRPYNLFHRKNLYMRLADVPRGFGNKKSWDRSFDDHLRQFVGQANNAVFDNGFPCRATCADVLDLNPTVDLVYIDTPYVSGKGVGVDYRGFYHFLEGMMQYESWPECIDHNSRHRRLQPQPNPWTMADQCGRQFQRLFQHFRASILVVSYRSDGIPSIAQLTRWLSDVKPRVRVVWADPRPYALSTNRRSREVLLIGTEE